MDSHFFKTLRKERSSTAKSPTKNVGSKRRSQSTVRGSHPQVTTEPGSGRPCSRIIARPQSVHVKVHKEEVGLRGRSGEPWSQMLRNQSKDSLSPFSKFDPLRTLHFLAKELQLQLNSIVPDEGNIQQMVKDMQQALQRVPPEVVSTIQLHQSNNKLPSMESLKSYREQCAEPECPYNKDKPIRDIPKEKMQRLMEESTMKLEASCRQMEAMCTILKVEKEELKEKLKLEQESSAFWKRKLEQYEKDNKEFRSSEVAKLKSENASLLCQLEELKKVLERREIEDNSGTKMKIAELSKAKIGLEHEIAKLKHQVKLGEIEKEKYIAVLSVRDKQINEIRSEMSQLQEIVNEQLMELHNNAYSCMPSNHDISDNSSTNWMAGKGNAEDVTPSTIHNEESSSKPKTGGYKIVRSRGAAPTKHRSNMEAECDNYSSTDSAQDIRDMLTSFRRQAVAIPKATFQD